MVILRMYGSLRVLPPMGDPAGVVRRAPRVPGLPERGGTGHPADDRPSTDH